MGAETCAPSTSISSIAVVICLSAESRGAWRRRRTSLHSRPNRSPKPIPGKGPEKVLRRRRPVARFRPKRRGFRSPRGLPFQRRRQETDMSRLSVEVRSLAFRTKWLVVDAVPVNRSPRTYLPACREIYREIKNQGVNSDLPLSNTARIAAVCERSP